jgi:hypothetical protein
VSGSQRNQQSAANDRFLGNLMISWCGHEWLLRVASRHKIGLPQRQLWRHAPKKGQAVHGHVATPTATKSNVMSNGEDGWSRTFALSGIGSSLCSSRAVLSACRVSVPAAAAEISTRCPVSALDGAMLPSRCAPAPSDAIKRAIGLPVPHDKPDGPLERLRQDTQVREARQQWRRHCVNLHKLDLISRDGWVRQDRGCAGHCIPNGKRDWKQDGLATSFDCYAPEKLFVVFRRGILTP